jgi:hypothetical protein
MKTQQEATIQFSGYPLSIVETKQKTKQVELTAVKPFTPLVLSPKNSSANDPKNWDIDWFNSYE